MASILWKLYHVASYIFYGGKEKCVSEIHEENDFSFLSSNTICFRLTLVCQFYIKKNFVFSL